MSHRQASAQARVIISGLSCLSGLGEAGGVAGSIAEGLSAKRAPVSALGGLDSAPVVPLSARGEELVAQIGKRDRYRKVDRVTQLALAAAVVTYERYNAAAQPIGCVAIGSSRGATISLEGTMSQHLNNESGAVPTYTSPVTTAGNISSWVAQEGIERGVTGESGSAHNVISLTTSMTCSSAYHSLLVALGFLRSGMAQAALFGGAESCLTPYTIKQLEALRIYTADRDGEWPCRPFAAQGEGEISNTVMLGEGAGCGIVRFHDGITLPGDLELLGIGWQMERIPSATGVTADGAAFEGAMRYATEGSGIGRVDAVIAHAPGSVRGDEAELAAVSRVFGVETPVLSTKHLSGHTYGASGMVSLALAAYLLEGGTWPGFPYPTRLSELCSGRSLERIMINTAGFGGNVISLVVGRA
jgi:3-oxoacyl-[acyl-carrier-protein] synthase II